MKFGSVAFFKKLIVTVFLLIVILPVGFAIFFGVMYAGQKTRADRLEAAHALAEAEAATPVAADPAPDTLLGDPYDLLGQQAAPTFNPAPSFNYQTRYPHLYAPKPAPATTEGKVCYLTFDDGPSQVTLQVLETLERFDIKATFFVTGENSLKNEEVLRAAAAAGHTIGVHTYSHEYKEIYASVDAFLEDFEQMYSRVLQVTGTAPTIFRFAGGSINVHNQFIYNEIIAEMTRRGFVFYDWNVAASDAVVGGISRQQVLDNVLNGVGDAERIVVLMHDRQDNISTASALPSIIERLAGMGYSFAPLTAEVQPITFFYQQ